MLSLLLYARDAGYGATRAPKSIFALPCPAEAHLIGYGNCVRLSRSFRLRAGFAFFGCASAAA
jgi:hypothetical protein